MAEKVTIMKLKVDLQCGKCYKKVKKVLCKFPQIRDQRYDEKENTVIIKVVCCNPEKIRDKLCCKGGGSIKSIEIVEQPKPKPPPPKEPEKPKPPPKEPEKPKEPPKEPEKPKEPPKEPAKPKEPEPPKEPPKEPEKPKEPPKEPEKPKPEPPKEPEKPKPESPKGKPPEPKPEPPPPVPGCPPALPPPMVVPIGVCCVPCYEGRPGGPCFEGYRGPPPPPCYCDGYYGRPIYDSYGGSRPCYVSRCDQYFSEENATGCTIM